MSSNYPPQNYYALRFFGRQFTITTADDKQGNCIPEETISREMISTEGYIGGIRNTMKGEGYMTERICRIDNTEGKIYVKKAPPIRTQPVHGIYLIPNFQQDYRKVSLSCGDSHIFNLRVTECQNIYGFFEIRNNKKKYYCYDKNFRWIEKNDNIKDSDKRVYKLPNLRTTGTIIFHPSFNQYGVKIGDIAMILFETFLKRNAFDRNDINYIGGKLYYGNDILSQGQLFVALYDVNELNITKRLTDENLLNDLFEYLRQNLDIIAPTICPVINDATKMAIYSLCDSILDNKKNYVYNNAGKNKTIKTGSIVGYVIRKLEDMNNSTTVKSIFLGYSGEDNTMCTLMVNGEIRYDIPLQDIETIDETIFN